MIHSNRTALVNGLWCFTHPQQGLCPKELVRPEFPRSEILLSPRGEIGQFELRPLALRYEFNYKLSPLIPQTRHAPRTKQDILTNPKGMASSWLVAFFRFAVPKVHHVAARQGMNTGATRKEKRAPSFE